MVDIAKAFDTIRWEFIFNSLSALSIPNQFLTWLHGCLSTNHFTVGYNGRIHGYFKATRGLRQGCPLSPTLFVIAMNTLSIMLDKAASEGKFSYHFGCKELKLTHLMFADDLLIFLDGSPSSLNQVLQVLKDFESLSGLAISPQKSTFFSARLPQTVTQQITQTTGLTHKSLPFKYLGLPLTSQRLSAANCAPLIQSVKSKISSWTAKSLSFAGRKQLLTSVIGGIMNFWCSSHLLPKGIIKAINSLCSTFLWHGNLETGHSARVAWSECTKLKTEGGLGIPDLIFWNKACAIKLILMLFTRSGSIWVAWFTKNISWITVEVGDGKNTAFWTDNWSPYGKLTDFLSPQGPSHLGIPITTTLSSLCHCGGWKLPPARSDKLLQLQIHLTSLILTTHSDCYICRIPNLPATAKLSTGNIYQAIRHNYPQVPWSDSVWFSKGIPKHQFLAWLTTLNRLPTRDRLSSWGIPTNLTCLLCNSNSESRDHIYFACPFSSQIWTPIASSLSLNLSYTWHISLQVISTLRSGKTHRTLSLIAWQASIYMLWTERNNRLHRQIYLSPTRLLQQIDILIRNKISSLRDSSSKMASTMMQKSFEGEQLRRI